MSKPAGAHPMTCFRIKLWAELFLAALKLVRDDKLSADEIDCQLYSAMGRTLRSGYRPRIMESLLAGREPRRTIRKYTIADCVRAGTRILNDDRLERMFFSPVWLMVIPEHRTIEFVRDAIHRVLKRSRLMRLSAPESVRTVQGLWDGSDGFYPPSERYVARARRYLVPLLRHWRKKQLISREDLAVVLVLMHQEAYLACRRTIADKLHSVAKAHALHVVRQFFSGAPKTMSVQIRLFESAMFYADSRLRGSRTAFLRASRYVSGLVVPSRKEKDRRKLRRTHVHDIWYALNPSPMGRGSFMGSG